MSFDALLKAIPDYGDQLLTLISGPRRFFAERDLGAKDCLVQALTFLFISVALGYVLTVPFLVGVDAYAYWVAAATMVVTHTFAVVVFGGLAFLCCRVMGGKGSLHGHVTIFAYFSGVSGLVFALFSLAAVGLVKAGLPNHLALYQEYMDFLLKNDFAALEQDCFKVIDESNTLRASMLILLTGLLVIASWLIVAWRAIGDWNRLTGRRVVAALVLFLVTGFAVNWGLMLAQSATQATPSDTESACSLAQAAPG